MTSERSNASDDDHRVVPFRPRGARARGGGWRWPRRTLGASPVEDLAKYEGGDEQDDNYRHRMMVNLAALGVTIALAVAGVWLAIQIADMRKNQDCLLSGRRNSRRSTSRPSSVEDSAPRERAIDPHRGPPA